MAWTVNAGTRVDGLITQIAANLVASGWTLTDRAADQVWHSTNDQGVTQYIQITEGGAYQYLQFQAWQSWDTGTHAGTNGSGTTYNRLYYASANQAGATTVDLYMSVTSNRFVIFIRGIGNYNNWAYFGGLDTIAGAADSLCAFLLCAYCTGGSINSSSLGVILQSYATGGFWAACGVIMPAMATVNTTLTATHQIFNNSLVGSDPTQVVAFPLYATEAIAPYMMRGGLDGLKFVPNVYGTVATLETLTIDAVTYLIIQPGGETAANYRPITGNYVHCLAIAEV